MFQNWKGWLSIHQSKPNAVRRYIMINRKMWKITWLTLKETSVKCFYLHKCLWSCCGVPGHNHYFHLQFPWNAPLVHNLKAITANVLPFILLPDFTAEHDVLEYGISLWPVGISCSSSQLLVHPQSPPWLGEVRSRKGLDFVQVLLSNNKNISLSSTLFPAQILNTAPQQLPWRKLTLL